MNNPFLPILYTPYSKYMDAISPDTLYMGLLGYGMFSEKLPPILSSAAFARHMRETDFNQKKPHDWVTYRYRREFGIFREFGIPHPEAYYMLVKQLKDKWNFIQDYFREHTSNTSYKISRIHIRKLPNSNRIFQMTYDESNDDDAIPALTVGQQYQVRCDISRCFPSTYTHAIEWAVVGKAQAKSNLKNPEQKGWSNELDIFTRNTTNGETQGILIGPHSSNLISEIILVRIDEELRKKGYVFVRFIDDFVCYTENLDKAERFPVDLDRLLSEYGYSINQRKTKISSLPTVSMDDWVRLIKEFKFPNYYLNKEAINRLFDLTISLIQEGKGTASAINYALKLVEQHELDDSGRYYLSSVGSQMLFSYPYLLPLAEKYIFRKAKMETTQIGHISNLIFQKCMNERDYLSCCYAFYFATIYNFKIDDLDSAKILESHDALLMLFAWLYAKEHDSELQQELHRHAKEIYDNTDIRDKYWIFVYEVLKKDEMDKNDSFLIKLKQNGISFIDMSPFSIGGDLNVDTNPDNDVLNDL